MYSLACFTGMVTAQGSLWTLQCATSAEADLIIWRASLVTTGTKWLQMLGVYQLLSHSRRVSMSDETMMTVHLLPLVRLLQDTVITTCVAHSTTIRIYLPQAANFLAGYWINEVCFAWPDLLACVSQHEITNLKQWKQYHGKNTFIYWR